MLPMKKKMHVGKINESIVFLIFSLQWREQNEHLFCQEAKSWGLSFFSFLRFHFLFFLVCQWERERGAINSHIILRPSYCCVATLLDTFKYIWCARIFFSQSSWMKDCPKRISQQEKSQMKIYFMSEANIYLGMNT